MSTLAPLHFEVFIGSTAALQPTSTLLYGDARALLVDAQLLRYDAQRLAERITKRGRTLTNVCITHAHPDTYFGLTDIKAAFPNAIVSAAPEVVDQIEARGPHAHAILKQKFRRHITDSLPTISRNDEGRYTIEGHLFRILHIGQGDIPDCTMLHCPDQDLLIAGDLVSNGTHLWLGDTTRASREQWLRNLRSIDDLNPKTIIAGRKSYNNPPDNGPKIVARTRAYIEDFNAIVADNKRNADAIITKMIKKYPKLELPTLLEESANAAAEEEDAVAAA